VNAGADLAITLPNTAVLDGTVTDDGLPSATVTTAWSTVSGPGTVIFGNAAAIDTSATFSLAGTYVLRLTANDSALSASDDVQVIVSATSQTGQILREWWTNISGTAISQLTADPRYPDQPTGTAMLTSFEVPTDVMDNYGTRVRGHIIPPTTGQYVFWIAGDDYCQLFLGTTALPGSKVLIARVDGWTSSRQWTKYAAQQSAPITLTAGVEYYIEALHKEGGGGDNLAVGWQMPGGTLERPIPGNRLKPFNPAVIQPPQISLTAPSASGGQLTAPATLTVSANASDADGTIAKVEFLQNGAVVATVTTPPFSTTLTGLTAGYYTVAARATDNDGLATTSAARWLTVINADGTGLLRRDWWSGLTGTSIAQLTSAPGYPGTPSGTDYRSLFEAPTDWANDYGTRLSGYVVAPVTGSYVFWIAGDDNCELWLSSNDSAASKVLIASVPGWTSSREWGKYPAQQSVAITLTAGARYWIEALQKEGGGGDNLAVGWQLPGGTQERPIPGNRLMPPVIAVAMLPQQRPVGWSVRR
jgi:Bacterial Ig domain/PA14 domain